MPDGRHILVADYARGIGTRDLATKHVRWVETGRPAMAGLPDAERPQFWHEEFLPLAAQERALREKLMIVGQGRAPTSSIQ